MAIEFVAAYNRKRLPKTGSPYLVGIHAPMQLELTLQDLVVTGSIPLGFNGRYLKMGANPVKPDAAGHHWFLGDGMVHGPCIHDCAFTARFVIVLDLPVTFSMRAVLGGHAFPFRWNPDHHARVGLLPRHGDGAAIIWCDVAACFVFHVANAFDGEDGQVILDVVAYDTMFATGASGLDALSR